MTSRQPDLSRAVALAVGGGALALYAVTACRTVWFGDSGELIAAAASLGVAHPPGYPLYSLLGKVALALPFGEPALAMNLLSAVCAAGACAALGSLATRMTDSAAAGVAAGGGLAVATPFWSVATVAEVYALHLALLIGLLVAAGSLGRAVSTRAAQRAAWLVAGALGLGLAHRPTLVLALPAAWLAWRAAGGRRDRLPSWPTIAGTLALVAGLPALLYVTLIPRARAGPALSWGDTVDLPRLLAHVTTRAYGHYRTGVDGWFSAFAWERLADVLWTAAGPVGLVLVALGLTGVARKAEGRRANGGARFVPLLLAVPTALFAMTYATPDVEVLHLPVVAALALAAAFGVADVTGRLPARRRGAATVAVAALCLLAAAARFPMQDRSSMTAARDYAEDMLASVPAGGALFVEGDDAFLLAYVTQVQGRRDDVVLYDRKGILFRDQAAEPGSPPRPGETGPAYRLRRETEFALDAMAARPPRAVLFMSWPGYELPRGLRFEPEGLLYRVRRADEPPAQVDALWRAYREVGVLADAERSHDPQALTVAATYALMRGERARFEGDREAALDHFDRAGRLAAGSESISNYLGTVFGRIGDYERAEREFQRALQALPVSVRAWNNLALARSLAGDIDGARAAWQRSLELRPNQAEVLRHLREMQR